MYQQRSARGMFLEEASIVIIDQIVKYTHLREKAVVEICKKTVGNAVSSMIVLCDGRLENHAIILDGT